MILYYSTGYGFLQFSSVLLGWGNTLICKLNILGKNAIGKVLFILKLL
jgi:hypothetical protein